MVTNATGAGVSGRHTQNNRYGNGGRAHAAAFIGWQVPGLAADGNIWMADVNNLSGMRKIIRGANWNFPAFSEDGKQLLLGTILPDGLEG
jgi:hypothetical protein